MRDSNKLCGLSIHQKATHISSELIHVLSGSGKGSSLKSLNAKLGVPCPEFPYKDIVSDSNSKKRKWNAAHPPTDYSNRIYMGVPDPSSPFSLFIWYTRKGPEDPECVCVDVTVDGKKSPGWILWPGKHRGIVIDQIMYRGRPTRFEFNSPVSGGKSEKPVNRKALGKPLVSGVIEVTFWRVMKLEREECEYSDGIEMDIDDDSPENEYAHNRDVEANPQNGVEYIPDEGLKALGVFTVYYRDMSWLLDNSVIKGNTPLGLCMTKGSELVSDDMRTSRTPLKEIENGPSVTTLSGTVSSSPAIGKPPKKRHIKYDPCYYQSELSTVLSSPGITRLKQVDFSLLGSSSPLPDKPPKTIQLSSDMATVFEVPDMIPSIRKDLTQSQQQEDTDPEINVFSVLASTSIDAANLTLRNAKQANSTSECSPLKRLRRERVPVYFYRSNDKSKVLHCGRIQISNGECQQDIVKRLESLFSHHLGNNELVNGSLKVYQDQRCLETSNAAVVLHGCSKVVPLDSILNVSHIESISVGLTL